jgi:hypothetical protein
VKSLEQ